MSPALRAHTLYNFDAMMNAFSRRCVQDGVLLPYVSRYDHVSWWLSQFFLMHYAAALYPDQIAKFSRIQIVNPLQRSYPRISEAEFDPYAKIYLGDGWRDNLVALESYRHFNDLLSEHYKPFDADGARGPQGAALRAIDMQGPLLGSRRHDSGEG